MNIAGAINNFGYYSGAPEASGGAVANSLCFNTTSDFMVVSNHAEIDFIGDCANGAESFTMDAWIRAAPTTATIETILDKRTNDTGNRGYSLFLNNGYLGCQIGDGSSQDYISSGPDLRDGQWHFIAWTLGRCDTNGNTGTLYLDGTAVLNFFDPRTGDLSNTADLQIGWCPPAFGENHYQGCIDELEFFKRALTAAEIQSIYDAGPGREMQNLSLCQQPGGQRQFRNYQPACATQQFHKQPVPDDRRARLDDPRWQHP